MDSLPARPLTFEEVDVLLEDDSRVAPFAFRGPREGPVFVTVLVVRSGATVHLVGFDPDIEEWSRIETAGSSRRWGEIEDIVQRWIDARYPDDARHSIDVGELLDE